MNFYEWIIENIKKDELKWNCPSYFCVNHRTEKELKGKSFEQVQKEAAKYGLYLTWNDDYNIAYDTHKYIFTLKPFNEIISKITSK